MSSLWSTCYGTVVEDRPQGSSPKEEAIMAIDPVCKMEVDEATAPARSEYKGTTYYFCAPGCKKDFDADPEEYLQAEQKDPRV